MDSTDDFYQELLSQLRDIIRRIPEYLCLIFPWFLTVVDEVTDWGYAFVWIHVWPFYQVVILLYSDWKWWAVFGILFLLFSKFYKSYMCHEDNIFHKYYVKNLKNIETTRKETGEHFVSFFNGWMGIFVEVGNCLKAVLGIGAAVFDLCMSPLFFMSFSQFIALLIFGYFIQWANVIYSFLWVIKVVDPAFLPLTPSHKLMKDRAQAPPS